MSKSRSAIVGLLAITLFLSASAAMTKLGFQSPRRNAPGATLDSAAEADVLRPAQSSPQAEADVLQLSQPILQASPVPAVTLRAASGSVISFATQNGATINNVRPLTTYVPQLVLYRNGALTDPDERTLMVEVTGIAVPPEGVTVTLQIETQHGDPDLGGGSGERIPVWRESQWITQTGVTVMFVHEFSATVMSGSESIATPTDYFRYDIAVIDACHSPANPWHAFSADYAFLMENQWIERLPQVQEESAGAAPDELILYYCDMFPFGSGERRLTREEAPNYVRSRLAPAMVKSFQTQTDGWAMGPWYDEWASFRGEKRLSVALAMPETRYHGRAFNHSAISVLTFDDINPRYRYETLIDGHMSVFDHELFHNLQRNISLNAGRQDPAKWKFFTEGQAVLAAAVAHSELEQENQPHYAPRANQFLRKELNKSYAKLDPYQAVLYWRFLFEQCGGMEQPAIGMQIIKRSLEELYVEERTANDIVAEMPDVMDRALAGSACPFQTYEDSLIAFARANYALHLENGRCAKEDFAQCGERYYDPDRIYMNPALEARLHYRGATLIYDGAIPASFGMDFLEISLAPTVEGQPLTVTFQSEGAVPQFDVQIWELGCGTTGLRASAPGPETTLRNQGSAPVSTALPLDRTGCDWLALIITRLDPHEAADRVGEYHLTLE